jgi:glycosyltransferase involved in cell wall biosynthesis
VRSLEVIICTHNPHLERLRRTLDGLRRQSLPFEQWALTVIDNASDRPLSADLVAWHPQGRVIREDRVGLTHARLRAIAESNAELLVWVDDDNVLSLDYLEIAQATFQGASQVGAAGGKSIPVYDARPPEWYQADLAPLGCRDLGDEEIRMAWDAERPTYPPAAPIGAGMIIRRDAIQAWADAVTNDPDRQRLGRAGASLASGEDNDINLTILRGGWELAYLPTLMLEHLIPAARLTEAYQRRIARASFRDFVKVLAAHGIQPWNAIPEWSVPLRTVKAWFTHRAWTGPAASIRWQGAVGQYEGRAAIRDVRRQRS